MKFEKIENLLAAIAAGGTAAPSKEVVESEMRRLGYSIIVEVPAEFKVVHCEDAVHEPLSDWIIIDEELGNICKVDSGHYALKPEEGRDIFMIVVNERGEELETSYLRYRDEVTILIKKGIYANLFAGSPD